MSSTINVKSETSSKWRKLIKKISFNKNCTKQELDTTFVEKIIASTTTNKEDTGSTWINVAYLRVSQKIKAFKRKEKGHPQHTITLTESPNALTTLHAIGILLPNKASDQQEAEIVGCGSEFEGHIVPLRQILRYSMDSSDRQRFQRLRITQPFTPVYEVEWEKSQWLQLDNSTNRKIERLRKTGFTKIAIRNDQILKKHIVYDDPSEADVLLEISLHGTKNKKEKTKKELEPIICHQPSKFLVRRTQWWRASYQVGEAHLPNWVDVNASCSKRIMDANSVLDAITGYSQSHLPPTQRSDKLPDTPYISQTSTVYHELGSFPTLQYSKYAKPLKYTEPPFLMSKPVLCAA